MGWTGQFLFVAGLLCGLKFPPLLSFPTTILKHSWEALAACQRTGSSLLEVNRKCFLNTNKGRSSLPNVACSLQLALQTAPCRTNPLLELCVPCKGNTAIHVSLPPLFFFFFWKMTMNAHEASITKDYGLQFSVCSKVVLNDQMLMRRKALLEK